MAEHLLGQCTALTEAMNRKHKKPIQPKIAEPQVASSKSQHSIHRLPPRERLEKYYEALQQLTENMKKPKHKLIRLKQIFNEICISKQPQFI